MIAWIIEILASFIIAIISSGGYPGVIFLMAIESACIPLPSEIIMPFSGYLVFRGEFGLFWVGLAGAFGCVVGSVPAYYLGLYGGRPLIEKYGKYVLVSHHDLDLADRWFGRYGDWAIFFSRLLPVVRTFISFPAGVAKMNVPRFIVYTFVGSFPWCLGLAYIGMKLGENWDTLGGYFHKFDVVIGILIAAGAVYYIWRHLKEPKTRHLDGFVKKRSIHARRANTAPGFAGTCKVRLQLTIRLDPAQSPAVDFLRNHQSFFSSALGVASVLGGSVFLVLPPGFYPSR